MLNKLKIAIMYRKEMKLLLVGFALINSAQLFAQSNKLSIQNGIISATYKPQSKTIEVKDIASGKTFLTKGVVENSTGAMPESVTDAVFGKGKALQLNKTDGGYYRFVLYPGVAFLFIQETLVNDGAQQTVLQKVQSFSFQVDLQSSRLQLLNRW